MAEASLLKVNPPLVRYLPDIPRKTDRWTGRSTPAIFTRRPWSSSRRYRGVWHAPLAAKARNRHYRTAHPLSRKNFAAMLSPLASAQTRAVADAMAAGQFGPSALKRRADEVRQHYDRVSASRGDYIAKNSYYYEQIYRLLRFIIPPGKRVLQVGCLTPDFLNAVAPSFGGGIDLCETQVDLAGRRFPHLRFHVHKNYDVANLGTFDHVIITDINDQTDP